MKTYSAKPTEVTRDWYIVDASEVPLGRLATQVAILLTGKSKPMFTHHIDVGDHVIVINADKLIVTGNKMEDKVYYRHSRYPGGLKETKLKDKMQKNSAEVIIKAVRGMLPVNKLRADRLARPRVYHDAEHNHEAQEPKVFSLKEGK